MSQQIKFENHPSRGHTVELLRSELRLITCVDTENQFKFIIRFIGVGSTMNNFTCKVYPYCTDDSDECLGTLGRGDQTLMRKIKKDFNEC